MAGKTHNKTLFSNKKVLLVGLGVLGGGLATAKYLLKKGARLTVTDLKTPDELKKPIEKIGKKRAVWRLGRHDEKDFKESDIIVFNQSVPFGSKWVKLARTLEKPIESDLTLFSREIKQNKGRYIGITGTRGKTTTSHWLAHFLPSAALGGNQPERGLLYLAGLKKKLYVLELSSFQLEYSNKESVPPKIAVITNLYVDHLNYHGSLKSYFKAKFKIFQNQTGKDFLILNGDNKYTCLVLREKPKSKIYLFSLSPLEKKIDGIFMDKEKIIFQEGGRRKFICEIRKDFSLHQRSNLLPAMLAAYLEERDWKKICARIGGLPEIPFRQEIILKRKGLVVVNDSAGTSPEAAMAAIDRFGKDMVLITGGTDKRLEFKALARKIRGSLKPKNLYLLEGSATEKLAKLLGIKNIRIFRTLKDIIAQLPSSGTIVFSPASASFEKFKNEFDRGEQFNLLAKKKWKK
jgi:UDP-N-acetylmuramoylalanine--D-glutamate ligase